MRPALRSALDASGYIGAWETDLDTQTVELTGKIADLLGIARDRASAGVPVTALLAGVHPDDRAGVARRLRGAHDSAGRFEAEFRTGGPADEACFVVARGRVEAKPRGPGLRCVGIVVDVTDSRRLDPASGDDRVEVINRIVDALIDVRGRADRLGTPVLMTLIDAALFELGRQLARHVEADSVATVH